MMRPKDFYHFCMRNYRFLSKLIEYFLQFDIKDMIY